MFAPLVCAFFVPVPNGTKVDYITLFKDGQLCWVALGFCVSGLYEIDVPLEGAKMVVESVAYNCLKWGSIFLLSMSAIVAGSGGVLPTPLGVPQNVKWRTHYRTLVNSVILTVASAIAYSIIHYGILR